MSKAFTNEQFIEKAIKIHDNKYDYSLVKYINSHIKVKIVCPIHGVFEKSPNFHLSKKQGCIKCTNENMRRKNAFTKEKFIEDANLIHKNEYDYSLVEYINAQTKVKIVCPVHGIFEQTPNHHISRGDRCPSCKESLNESIIRRYLQKQNIFFIPQFRFDKCRKKYPLPFDFYLPKLNILIEYDGIQHFKEVEYFGGKKALKEVQNNDKIKTNYAKNNNIKLLRIRYDENAEEVLKERINDTV